MKHLYIAYPVLLILAVSSCSEHDDAQAHPSDASTPEAGDIKDLEDGVSIEDRKSVV